MIEAQAQCLFLEKVLGNLASEAGAVAVISANPAAMLDVAAGKRRAFTAPVKEASW